MTVFVPAMPRTAQAVDAFDALAEVDSTNAELRRRCLAADPFVTGLAAQASAQSAMNWAGTEQGEGMRGGVAVGALAAQAQVGGHGRLGRSWTARPGESFVMSFLAVLPRDLVFGEFSGWLTMAAGVAAAEGVTTALHRTGAHALEDGTAVRLKWPNDVFVVSPDRGPGAGHEDGENDRHGEKGEKLGGILTEAAELPLPGSLGRPGESARTARIGSLAAPAADGFLRTAVPGRSAVPDGAEDTGAEDAGAGNAAAANMVAFIVGIGLNLGIPADRLPTDLATSLQLHYGPLPGFDELRDLIGEGIAVALRRELTALAAPQSAVPQSAASQNAARRVAARDLYDRMVPLCWTLGRPVEARTVDGSVLHGTAERLGSDASLVVRDDTGRERVVHTGDVGVLDGQTRHA